MVQIAGRFIEAVSALTGQRAGALDAQAVVLTVRGSSAEQKRSARCQSGAGRAIFGLSLQLAQVIAMDLWDCSDILRGCRGSHVNATF